MKTTRAHTSTNPSLMATGTSSNNKSKGKSRSKGIAYDDHQKTIVQWYPGHIAKAERLLKETFLRAVDVVVEVRDARIAKATSHPKVAAWCAGRPRLVVLTHVDQIPNACQKQWKEAFAEFGAESFESQLEELDGQIINQARQAARERAKYVIPSNKNDGNYRELDRNDDASKVFPPVGEPLFVDAKLGLGIPALKRAISQAGAHVQERRVRKGLKERSLRVGILGYPNVGKSALINRLLGRRRARSANTPGVTRSLQWIRVRSEEPDSTGRTGNKAKDFELLDSPGIIPVSLNDQQSDAVLLAACNCIGPAAYDNQEVAAYLCEWLLAVHRLGYGVLAAPRWRKACIERYKFDPLDDKEIVRLRPDLFGAEDASTHRPRTGEDMLFDVADNTCQGDPEDAARKILQDFRTGRMGSICLQIAPRTAEDAGQIAILDDRATEQERKRNRLEELGQMQQNRAQEAQQAAVQLGLELPPMFDLAMSVNNEEASGANHTSDSIQESRTTASKDDVGKGLFDGW